MKLSDKELSLANAAVQQSLTLLVLMATIAGEPLYQSLRELAQEEGYTGAHDDLICWMKKAVARFEEQCEAIK
jgi:hypothetical protein